VFGDRGRIVRGRLERDFENLIGQVGRLIDLIQGHGEQLQLGVEIEPIGRPVQADQAQVERRLGILALAAWGVRRPPEVVGVACYEGPVATQNDRQEVPVLHAGLADPSHVRAVDMSSLDRQANQLGAQAFIDEKLHARCRRATLCSETKGRRGEAARAPLGRPRGGLASA